MSAPEAIRTLAEERHYVKSQLAHPTTGEHPGVQLINDILDPARLQAHECSLTLEPIDVAAPVADDGFFHFSVIDDGSGIAPHHQEPPR